MALISSDDRVGVNAAYTHNWNAAWKSTLWGSYMAQSYNTAGNNLLCTGSTTGVDPGAT